MVEPGHAIAITVVETSDGWVWVARTASGDRVGDGGRTFVSSLEAKADARASAPPSATITVAEPS